jgi:hypothetical protein
VHSFLRKLKLLRRFIKKGKNLIKNILSLKLELFLDEIVALLLKNNSEKYHFIWLKIVLISILSQRFGSKIIHKITKKIFDSSYSSLNSLKKN